MLPMCAPRRNFHCCRPASARLRSLLPPAEHPTRLDLMLAAACRRAPAPPALQICCVVQWLRVFCCANSSQKRDRKSQHGGIDTSPVPASHLLSLVRRPHRPITRTRTSQGIKYFYDITDRGNFKANPDYKGVCHVALAQEGHTRPGEVRIYTHLSPLPLSPCRASATRHDWDVSHLILCLSARAIEALFDEYVCACVQLQKCSPHPPGQMFVCASMAASSTCLSSCLQQGQWPPGTICTAKVQSSWLLTPRLSCIVSVL